MKTTHTTPVTTADTNTADRLIRDMAFVLAMTRKVREEMTTDPNPAASSELPIPFRSVTMTPFSHCTHAAA